MIKWNTKTEVVDKNTGEILNTNKIKKEIVNGNFLLIKTETLKVEKNENTGTITRHTRWTVEQSKQLKLF